ncbi:Uncharacterised protein [Mycobacteroides abscessus subsp. abscessus]|nr:Uncharacterised protein [Mycobacteroides abscessus subsp. abscessus]
MNERVGCWLVTVGLDLAVAQNLRTGTRAATCVNLFPVGYRVGQQWSTPVPKAVRKAADRLARQWTAAL